MPQKDKDVRKEYNRQQYLKRKQSQNSKQDDNNMKNEDNTYYLLRHQKRLQIVNNEYLNVKLKTINKVNKSCFPNELLNEIKNLDNNRADNFIKYFDKVATLDGFLFHFKNYNKYKYRFDSVGSTHFDCVFGNMCVSNIKSLTIEIVSKLLKPIRSFKKYKCGVEVLGMKPNKTKDGKYRYEGVSITDLKQACKTNDVKGYSSCDKLELVKLLMKC